MKELIEDKAVTNVTDHLDVTEQRATWVLLCLVVMLVQWISGASLFNSVVVFSIAALPALAHIFISKFSSEAAHELEMAVWIVVGMIGSTAMGGAISPMSIAFFIPVLTALSVGRKRQAIEASAFSVLSFCLAALLSKMNFLPISNEVLGPAPSLFALISLVYMASLVRKISLSSDVSQLVGRVREQSQRNDALLRRQNDVLVERIQKMRSRMDEAVSTGDIANEKASLLEKRMDERTLFFAKTSHELRTPLNAILGFSEIMKEGVFGDLPEKYQDYAKMIHEGGQSLLLTVDDILDLSKMEAGQFTVTPQSVSLTELTWDIVRFLGDQAKRAEVKLSISSREKDVEAYADPRAVRQIALNLVANAIKFTPKGGSIGLNVRMADDGGAWLSVRDSGPGIDEKVFADILKPFVQTELADKSNAVGTGLGLSVANAFAQLHGGFMQLDSDGSDGSVISVYFPKEGSIEDNEL